MEYMASRARRLKHLRRLLPNHGRMAFVTADIIALRGGVPIHANGEVVDAVGVADLSKETNIEIANAAAVALSPH
jgi:glc operon protein GlcG